MVVRLLCYKSQKTLVLRNESFLSEPTGLAYNHALACISLPHECGASNHTVEVYQNFFRNDDIQN